MVKRGRPKKIRYVQSMPKIELFSPRGKAGRPDEVYLRIDQYETIKLADYKGLSQAEGAMAMGVSRASFGRILREGRKILADGLVNGKIIRIGIGDVQVGVRKMQVIPHRKVEEEVQNLTRIIAKSVSKSS